MPNAPSEALRPFGQPDVVRDRIFRNVLDTFKSLPPLVGSRYTLRLTDVRYGNPERFSKKDERDAILRGKTLSRPLYGTWEILDTQTNKVLKRDNKIICRVPYLSSHGTFILRGTDYTMANQMRLRPGIYTRVRETGEIENHVNVAHGYGHRYVLNPESGVFNLEIGQAAYPLYPILRALGATERDIQEAWGNDLYELNAKKHNPKIVATLVKRLLKSEKISNPDEAIKNIFSKMTLDPETTQITLGRPFEKVNAETILEATKKLLRVYRNEDVPDDRDAMIFQQIYGPEDVIAERIKKNLFTLRKLFWKIGMRGPQYHIPTGVFNHVVMSAVYGTGLGTVATEINPTELYDYQWRVTRMGEGGIGSVDAIPESSRMVHPTHFGFMDPVHTPEKETIGVDTRLAIGTMKGPRGQLLGQFLDTSTGKLVHMTPQEAYQVPIAFPGEIEHKQPYVRVIWKGRQEIVPRKDVRYQLPTMQHTFGPLVNWIPFIHSTMPARLAIASRMITQALPLANPEAPLVRTLSPDGKTTFDQILGEQLGALRSPEDGQVVAVSPTEITIKSGRKNITVELDHNRFYNRKTMFSNIPLVKPGDIVKRGQLIAKSNFTDDDGNVALGVNAYVAYIPFGGNYEDAIVISESFAKRTASNQAYQNILDLSDDIALSKDNYISLFPGKYPADLLKSYDSHGVIRVGSIVQPNQPLILALKKRPESMRLTRNARIWSDASLLWDHQTPGRVVAVHKDHSGVNVVVETTEISKIGDKFTGRFSDKGVCAAIIPDDQMPRDKEGRVFDIVINPLTVTPRGNPSQIYEAILGKIVKRTGRAPYIISNFDPNIDDWRSWVEKEAKQHGVNDVEDIVDPRTGRVIPNILTGYRYFMKLHHTAESKAQSRALGEYTAEGMPSKSGDATAKRVGLAELNALLSHGAYYTIRDAHLIRGQKNEDYWRQFMAGFAPPEPDVPFVYQKFLEQLRSAGIQTVKRAGRINIFALTNDDIKELTGNRKIENSQTVDWNVKKLTPIAGGLFDEQLTGGHGGKRYSYIELPEPMPSPVMEEPIRRILGLTEAEFREVLAGKREFPAGSGKTGVNAMLDYLERMNLNDEIKKEELNIRDSRRTVRDTAVRRLNILQMCRKLKQHPKDWFWDRVPVLPPAFRPVALMVRTRTPLVADMNYLYKDLFDAIDIYKDLSKITSDVSDQKLVIYDTLKAITGMGEPITAVTKQRKLKGLLVQIFGSSPKYSVMQHKLLSAQTDISGRATITPNPNLDIDHVGIPESQAWILFRPFIIRRLVRSGLPLFEAARNVQNKTDVARKAMLEEMEERPVIINRAPVLHKYGVLAFWPQLTKSDTLEISPAVTAGFGADFDGDAMQFHVPVDPAAVAEAKEKLLPSRVLFTPASFNQPAFLPRHEYVVGLWAATQRDDNKPVRVFRSKQDAIAAYRRGELQLDQPIEILEKF